MLTRSQTRRVKPTNAHVDLGDGDSLNIVFDRNKITPAWIDETDRRAREAQDVFALAGAIGQVVESWDLFEDDGVTPVAPTQAELGQLAFSTLGAIVGVLISAASPSRAEGNASSGLSSIPSSASTPPDVTPQNGPAISPSPVLSESPSLT